MNLFVIDFAPVVLGIPRRLRVERPQGSVLFAIYDPFVEFGGRRHWRVERPHDFS